MLAHNEERINALTAEIAHQKETATGQPLKEQLAAVAEHLRNGTPEERRGWLRACVVRVTVHPDELVIDTFLGKYPVYRNAPDGWPSRPYDKPLRLLFPIRRARGARGRILLQNSGLRAN